ncbi:MAG: biotin--[acetyl-CoA-carboxylase] ligase [Candidatus Omnitrophota bacterium]
MKNKILNFLRASDNFVSGEDISRHLLISRAGIWKHINQLRKEGYEILAVPHLGYRLESTPDRLKPEEVEYKLGTRILGKKIYYYEVVPSTNDEAMRLGLSNAPEGTIVLAESQTKGRGRLGRAWHSPKTKGIYLSVILRPKIIPNASPILTLMASASVCEAIKKSASIDAQIKWPNDILVRHKKIGGILTELKAEMDVVSFVVIGLGLNVNNDKKTLPEGATSLREQKKEDVNRLELLQEILRALEENYLIFKEDGAGPILEKWRAYNLSLGKRVKVVYQSKHLEGMAVDIDSDGGLLIRKDSGLIEKVMAGDIIHFR